LERNSALARHEGHFGLLLLHRGLCLPITLGYNIVKNRPKKQPDLRFASGPVLACAEAGQRLLLALPPAQKNTIVVVIV
jgi:hypothetical protein